MCRVGGRRLASRAWPTDVGLLPPPIEPCMRFSRTRLTVACSPGGIRQGPPGPVGPGRLDGSGEDDQPGAFGRPQSPAAPCGCLVVALGHEDGEPVERVTDDLVELAGRVSVAEVARPATQKAVDLLRDMFDTEQ